MVQIGTMIASPFPDLFADSIGLHLLAEENSVEARPIENCFARSSILNVVFAVEAAANCCLGRLNLPQEEFDEIERKRPIEKYAFLYETGFGKKLDKGNRITQSMAELITLRNSFAHPRATQPEVIEIPIEVSISLDGKISGIFQNRETKPEVTQFLKIPWSPRLLSSTDSKKSLLASIAFLDYFFCDLCEFDQKQIGNFLYNHGPGANVSYVLKHQQELFQDLKNKIGVQPRFLLIEESTAIAT
jgi:hypothetical protein